MRYVVETVQGVSGRIDDGSCENFFLNSKVRLSNFISLFNDFK